MTNKKRKSKDTNIPSLSSSNVKEQVGMSKDEIKALNEKVYSAINNLELQKSLDKWLKDNAQQTQVVKRDMALLKNHVSEYMDSFLLFGYNMDGDRVIIQNFKTARDRDAVMEFLKTIFLKQQHENFLDE
jgi:uncharacterized protein (UPF0297 family)